MPARFEYDESKFKELMLYVSARLEGDPSFGATKLNKVLFFSDMFHYAMYGKPITGAEYQRLQWGPAPRRLLPARQQLLDEGRAIITRTTYLGIRQERLVPRQEPNIGQFSSTEIETVDRVLETLWGRGAVTVSRISHENVGWQVADPGETIPYETIFLTPRRPLSPEQTNRGRQLAHELGLELA